MPNLVSSVKGVRDFYPEDWAYEMWLYEKVKEVSRLFGFEEYEGPTLEYLDLYAAKSGEELVKKQAFTLTDQAGKTLALRPEMTPTLARMVAQKEGSLSFPVKWFTFGRRFRYEKPQRGRGREFFQWDCDILGLETVEADAEIITVAVTFLQKLGLNSSEVRIKINDRTLLQKKFQDLEIAPEKTISVFRLLDKIDKVSQADFKEIGQEEGLSARQINDLLKLTEEKNLYKNSPWLTQLFELLEKYGVADYVEFDPKIVRGLEYYTRTVFEGWDAKGKLRAIWGGGRYDNLTADVGSRQKIPGVGFAMGDMVILELLRSLEKLPSLSVNPTQVLVTVFSPDFLSQSIEIGQNLRMAQINTEVFLDTKTKLDRQIKYADKKGIPFVIILGPDEIKNKQATIKNLRTGEQKTIAQADLLKELKF